MKGEFWKKGAQKKFQKKLNPAQKLSKQRVMADEVTIKKMKGEAVFQKKNQQKYDQGLKKSLEDQKKVTQEHEKIKPFRALYFQECNTNKQLQAQVLQLTMQLSTSSVLITEMKKKKESHEKEMNALKEAYELEISRLKFQKLQPKAPITNLVPNLTVDFIRGIKVHPKRKLTHLSKFKAKLQDKTAKTDLRPVRVQVQNKMAQTHSQSDFDQNIKEIKPNTNRCEQDIKIISRQAEEHEVLQKRLEKAQKRLLEQKTLESLKDEISSRMLKFASKRDQIEILLGQQEREIKNNKRLLSKINEAITMTEGPKLREIQKELGLKQKELSEVGEKLKELKESLFHLSELEDTNKYHTEQIQKVKDGYEAKITAIQLENEELKSANSKLTEELKSKEAALEEKIEELRRVKSKSATEMTILRCELKDLTQRNEEKIASLEEQLKEERLKRQNNTEALFKKPAEMGDGREPEENKMLAVASILGDEFIELSTIIEDSELFEQSNSMLSSGIFDENIKSLKHELMNMKQKYERSRQKVHSLKTQLNESKALFNHFNPL